jgi:hypothetical protein
MGAEPRDGSLARQQSELQSFLPSVGYSTPAALRHGTAWLGFMRSSNRRGRARIDLAAGRYPLTFTVSLFALAFVFPAWPWLSGRVTVPWDAKSQFLPPLQFLAWSLASGQSPFWTPNIFGGWPLISDPQSLFFSPLHLLLTYFDPAPSFRAIDSLTFAYLLFGGIGIILYFRDRGWHAAGALVAALAFAFGGSAKRSGNWTIWS